MQEPGPLTKMQETCYNSKVGAYVHFLSGTLLAIKTEQGRGVDGNDVVTDPNACKTTGAGRRWKGVDTGE